MKRIKKRIAESLMLLMCTLAFATNVSAAQETEAGTAVEEKVLIQTTSNDNKVIPDKFNTGCKGELTKMEALAVTVNGIQLVGGSNNTRRVLDFYYRNKDAEGTIYFENYDFSDYPFWGMHENTVTKKIHVVFNNCKFAGVTLSKIAGNVTYEFNDCSFKSVNGGNATINRCKFGGSYSDGIVPFQNVEINDCFFSDMSYISPDKEIHTDGTQIYGYDGVEVQNVSYNNCRFEVPPLSIEGSKAYVNACIMLQLEYNNAKNLSFKDCIVNGGGYTIYARGKKTGFTFDNVTFDGIYYGGASRYGLFYTDIEPTIDIKNVHKTDSLYIASVWKEDGKIHLSVTNDTNQNRTLKIITENGEYTESFEACKTGNSFTTADTYESMPFDREIIIEDSQYVVCYDTTTEGYAKQIRFVNWSDQDVYLDKSVVDELTSGENDILLSGSCGKTVTYTLTKAGVLTLSGSGYTDSFNSGKFPEWKVEGYLDYIKEIVVEEGIEGLGMMIFDKCPGVEKVTLPDTLKRIGQYAFRQCSCLKKVVLPAGLEQIDRSAFGGMPLKEIYYKGENWDDITLGIQNTWLNDVLKYDHDGEIIYRIIYELNDTEEQPAKNDNPKTFVAGDSITFKDPTRDGYEFDGWYADATLTKKRTGIDKSVTENVKIYAKWIEEASSTPDEPSDEPTDKPGDEPTDEPGDEPTDKPGDEPTDKPGDETTDKPDDGTTDKPGDETTDKPDDGTTDKPGDEPTDKPGDEPADKPGDEPTDKPGNETTDKPGDETADKPVTTTNGVIFKNATVTLKPGKKVNNIKEVPESGNVIYKSQDEKVAIVTVKGIVKGINAGKTTIEATINGVTTSFEVKVAPKKVKNFKVKRKGSTALKISWAKDTKANGYQIVMKTGKTGKYKIVKTIKKKKTIRFTKTKLKKGKTYYIKMRAYKVIDGKKVYGAYSAAKKMTIK